MTRTLNKSAIHAKAVELGRASPNNMQDTANRLAYSNVDSVIESIISRLKPKAWELQDAEIIQACANDLWYQWCQAELAVRTGESQ